MKIRGLALFLLRRRPLCTIENNPVMDFAEASALQPLRWRSKGAEPRLIGRRENSFGNILWFWLGAFPHNFTSYNTLGTNEQPTFAPLTAQSPRYYLFFSAIFSFIILSFFYIIEILTSRRSSPKWRNFLHDTVIRGGEFETFLHYFSSVFGLSPNSPLQLIASHRVSPDDSFMPNFSLFISIIFVSFVLCRWGSFEEIFITFSIIHSYLTFLKICPRSNFRVH